MFFKKYKLAQNADLYFYYRACEKIGTGLLKRDKFLKVFLGKLFTTLLLNHHKSLLDKPCS
ncbi:MAG: hypothetical protein ACOVVP_06115, partial [Pseudanabaena sp.]